MNFLKLNDTAALFKKGMSYQFIVSVAVSNMDSCPSKLRNLSYIGCRVRNIDIQKEDNDNLIINILTLIVHFGLNRIFRNRQ